MNFLRRFVAWLKDPFPPLEVDEPMSDYKPVPPPVVINEGSLKKNWNEPPTTPRPPPPKAQVAEFPSPIKPRKPRKKGKK